MPEPGLWAWTRTSELDRALVRIERLIDEQRCLATLYGSDGKAQIRRMMFRVCDLEVIVGDLE